MEKITIEKAMENIYSNKYLIPSFQREYVWDKKKIAELFSSIMSDYPISTMLFWEINSEDGKNLCEFYQFLKKFKKGDKNNNLEPDVASKSEFIAIIDGQQRLTSLYLAIASLIIFFCGLKRSIRLSFSSSVESASTAELHFLIYSSYFASVSSIMIAAYVAAAAESLKLR